MPRKTAAASARSVYTIGPCTMSLHFVQKLSHKRRVHACLAVTCHLHFWQHDRDRLRATVVTRGADGLLMPEVHFSHAAAHIGKTSRTRVAQERRKSFGQVQELQTTTVALCGKQNIRS